MKTRKVLTFAAALLGSATVSVGLAAVASPVEPAKPVAGRASAAPPVAELLDEMAPGAVVEKHADGSVSIAGTAAPAVQAEIREAVQVQQAGPSSVRCSGGPGAVMRCMPVADGDVVAALKAGHKLYGRTVYRSVTQAVTDRGDPVLHAGELVCVTAHSDRPMTCTRVDLVRPVISAGATVFASYRPYEVTFDNHGVMTVHMGRPAIPIERAAP